MSSPWIGVVLVLMGLTAAVAFSLLHIGGEAGGIAFAVITAGIAIAQARGHDETQRELTTLRRSMRPPAYTEPPALPAPDPSQPFPPESPTGRWPRK